MQRLKTRPQFQAAMAGGTVSRTAHFALHRLALTASDLPVVSAPPSGPGSLLLEQGPQALFVVSGVWGGCDRLQAGPTLELTAVGDTPISWPGP